MTKLTNRTSVELLPGQTEAIQKIALELGYRQERGVFAGKLGSMSQLMRAIATGEVKVIKADPDPATDNAPSKPQEEIKR